MYCKCGNNKRPKYVGTDKSYERNIGVFYCDVCSYTLIYIAAEDGILPNEARSIIVLEILDAERVMICENENF